MEASELTGHVARHVNRDVAELRNSVLKMGGLVEAQLSRAITAIVSGDSELGLTVANDDYRVNRAEVTMNSALRMLLPAITRDRWEGSERACTSA